MKLTKAQRAALKGKYQGRCAYCGTKLGETWHVDHLIPVLRETRWVDGRLVPTNVVQRREADVLENMMPACPPCNIDKNRMSLNDWRRKLKLSVEVLRKHSPTFRHALRFGLLQETRQGIVFFFESPGAPAAPGTGHTDAPTPEPQPCPLPASPTC